ncbi:hypothetical protein NECAME_17140, partial [Necator americanus]
MPLPWTGDFLVHDEQMVLGSDMFGIVTIMCAMPFIIPSFKEWVQSNLVFFYVSICVGIAYVLGTTMMFFGLTAIIACFAFQVTFLYTVYAVLGALLSMLYLAIDIQ